MERLANRVMLLWGIRRAGLAILAGAIGALALPPFSFLAALFVSFTLLVWLMDGCAEAPGSGRMARWRSTFLLGWLFGFGYFVAGLWWLGNALLVEADEFAWALPLAILGLPAFLALYYGLATWLAGLLWSDGFGRIAALAASFGLIEWLRGLLFTGFPWNAIGYGVMPVPIMMQSTAAIGIFGVSTLAVFVLSAPALIGTRKGAPIGLALAGLMIAAHFGYGAYRLSERPTAHRLDPPVTVRVVQPVIDQARKMDTGDDRRAVFEEHLALTALPPKPGTRRPDIVIWPETSVPFILTETPGALARIADVLEDGQILIAGVVRMEARGAGQEPLYYNSIYAIDSQGQIIAATDKVHLTPFGEYLPFERFWNRLGISNIVDMPGGFTAGTRPALITLPSGASFYPLICYEAIFPNELTADAGRAAALLNITNDAWFGRTPGPYQHFLQARLRAVETGLTLIRGANSGVSAVIDGHGQIKEGLDFDQKGVIDSTLGGDVVPSWDIYARETHFWLLIITMFLIAGVSRMGLKIRLN
ncbi:Apolipoprotein N-acyltransferase [Rhizobium sp. RU35A]|uniref:Apolipoprotein N-acyltransferase n=1 Tax=Rhizobium straminoryzae TaxID=1387186 RepID=A0A549TH27_9HYPH|nr:MULTISPECIES: apolipoprotein N-acyltransferase [Rhizobium]TRL42152.1 apolipoprotein N-acyltransferase [Rhizobium straminoryzae]SIR13523.1 Apolipoprotein N-acyltransferase [Rhizobium sp. RU35A]